MRIVLQAKKIIIVILSSVSLTNGTLTENMDTLFLDVNSGCFVPQDWCLFIALRNKCCDVIGELTCWNAQMSAALLPALADYSLCRSSARTNSRTSLWYKLRLNENKRRTDFVALACDVLFCACRFEIEEGQKRANSGPDYMTLNVPQCGVMCCEVSFWSPWCYCIERHVNRCCL